MLNRCRSVNLRCYYYNVVINRCRNVNLRCCYNVVINKQLQLFSATNATVLEIIIYYDALFLLFFSQYEEADNRNTADQFIERRGERIDGQHHQRIDKPRGEGGVGFEQVAQ